jgi:hypothetical protein
VEEKLDVDDVEEASGCYASSDLWCDLAIAISFYYHWALRSCWNSETMNLTLMKSNHLLPTKRTNSLTIHNNNNKKSNASVKGLDNKYARNDVNVHVRNKRRLPEQPVADTRLD